MAHRKPILVRHGNGDKRREVGMDQWGWELLRPWLEDRVQIPVGPLFCVIDGAPGAAADDDERAPAARGPDSCAGRSCHAVADVMAGAEGERRRGAAFSSYPRFVTANERRWR